MTITCSFRLETCKTLLFGILIPRFILRLVEFNELANNPGLARLPKPVYKNSEFLEKVI